MISEANVRNLAERIYISRGSRSGDACLSWLNAIEFFKEGEKILGNNTLIQRIARDDSAGAASIGDASSSQSQSSTEESADIWPAAEDESGCEKELI